MKFGEYLQFLHKYLGADMKRADFVLYITDLFLKDPQTEYEEMEDDNDSYNPLSGSTRKLERIYDDELKHTLPKRDARKLRAKYDSSKFNEEMLALSPEIVKVVVADLNEIGVSANKSNYFKKCAEVYYRFLDNLSDGLNEIEDLSAINNEKQHTSGEGNSNNCKQDMDLSVCEATLIAAKAFYKRHEAEMGLIPLCAIADKLYPLRKNMRAIYNDYTLQTAAVKKEICKITNNEDIVIADNWMNTAIKRFDERILELNLATRSFLYDGGKYYFRAIEIHGNEPFRYYDPCVFKSHHEKPKYVREDDWHVTLSTYLSEYLFDKVPYIEYSPPWDGLWNAFDLGNASQAVMTNIVCIFIICTCKLLVPVDSDAYSVINRLFDYEGLLEKQEDLYYYAALCLYAFYCCEKASQL